MSERFIIQKRQAIKGAIHDALLEEWRLPCQPAESTYPVVDRLIDKLNRLAGLPVPEDPEDDFTILSGQIYFCFDIMDEDKIREMPAWDPQPPYPMFERSDLWINESAVGWDTSHRNQLIAAIAAQKK